MAINREGIAEIPEPLMFDPGRTLAQRLQAGGDEAARYMDRVRYGITIEVQGQVAYDDISKILDHAQGMVKNYLLTGKVAFRDEAENLIRSAADVALAIRAMEGDPGATRLLKILKRVTGTDVQIGMAALTMAAKASLVGFMIGGLLNVGSEVASMKLDELKDKRAAWREDQAKRLKNLYTGAKERQWRAEDDADAGPVRIVYVDRPIKVPVIVRYEWNGTVTHEWAPDPLRALKGQAALTREQARAAHAQAQTAATEAAAAPGNAELSAGARTARRAADAARDTWRQAEGELLAAQYDNPALKAAFLAAERAGDLAAAAAAAAAPQPAPALPPLGASTNAPSVAPTAPPPAPPPPPALSPDPARPEPPPAKAQPHDLGPRVPSTPYSPSQGGRAAGSLSGLNLLIASSIRDDGAGPTAQACTQPHLTPEAVQAICKAFLAGMIDRLR